MLAIIQLGDWSSVATILGTVLLLGGILLTQVRKRRGVGRSRHAIDEVVIGVPEVKDERTGRVIQPERPGLIDRMDEMDAWRVEVREKLEKQDEKLDTILTRVTPNGGDTQNPGDTAVRIEGQVKQIAEHIGLELGP